MGKQKKGKETTTNSGEENEKKAEVDSGMENKEDGTTTGSIKDNEKSVAGEGSENSNKGNETATDSGKNNEKSKAKSDQNKSKLKKWITNARESPHQNFIELLTHPYDKIRYAAIPLGAWGSYSL